MAFTLIYDLEGAGWADARIGNGDKYVDVTVSYLYDSLSELGEAAVQLRRGRDRSQVRFMDEPGEHILIITRHKDTLQFELRWHEDWQTQREDSRPFKVVLTGETNVAEFVEAVRAQLVALEAQYGVEGYKAKWVNHDFPVRALRDLQSAL